MLLLTHTLQSATLQTVHWLESNSAVLNFKARKAQPRSFWDSISDSIIHRINYPKLLAGKVSRKASLNARSRPLLSQWDSEEIKQAVGIALVATGAWEREAMTFADWKPCFRAARKAINVDRDSKRGQSTSSTPIHLLDQITDSQARAMAVSEFQADIHVAKVNGKTEKTLQAKHFKPYLEAKEAIVARKIRYEVDCLRASFALDRSRKRKASFKKQLRVLRYLASIYKATGQGFSEITTGDSDDNLAVIMFDYREYRKRGEDSMTAETLKDAPKARKVELKSLSEIAVPFKSIVSEIRQEKRRAKMTAEELIADGAND